MGWTSYHATHYKNGKVDVKAECDAYYMEGLNAGHFEVVKSAMVGSVYYAAIRPLVKYAGKDENGNSVYMPRPENERKTFAEIMLTHVDSGDYYNFSYKNIGEEAGPCESKCPVGIIKLLDETDSEWALAWRKRCLEYAEQKKSPNSIGKLPVGSRIKFTDYNGTERVLVKMSPAYQFKSCWWLIEGQGKYYPKAHIPSEYEVLSR